MCACTARFNVLQRFLSLCLLCRSVPSERHALLWLFSLCRSAVTTNPIPYANVQAIGGVIYGSVSFVGMSSMVGVECVPQLRGGEIWKVWERCWHSAAQAIMAHCHIASPLPLQMAVMPLVGMERVVFYRERAASYYNTWSYGLVMSMVELPYQLVQV